MTAKKRFPSDEQDQFMIRFPAGMRAEIKDAAAANNRTMNAEILARLSGQQRTLRDWFAGQAMAATIPNYEGVRATADKLGILPNAIIAGAAYEYADAMLAARESQP